MTLTSEFSPTLHRWHCNRLGFTRYYTHAMYTEECNDAVRKSYIKVSRLHHGTSESPIVRVNNEIKWVISLSFYSLTAVFGLLLNLSKPQTSYQPYSWPFGCSFLGGFPTPIWPWKGSNYPSRSYNGPNGSKGPK